MRKLQKFLIALALLLVPSVAFGQAYTLTQTTLSANTNASVTSFSIASATGATVTNNTNATDLYVDRELMQIVSVSGTVVSVLRGVSGTQASAHASGAMVLLGAPPAFQNYDPEGYCNIAPTVPMVGQSIYVPALPLINTRTGAQWLCSTVSNTWIPGFGNPGLSGNPVSASASVTGATITPSGPLSQFTGTTALVTINVPVGCGGNGSCTVTLDFTGSGSGLTWTAAGNISVAGTLAAAGSVVTFTYVPSLSTPKWVPSRVT